MKDTTRRNVEKQIQLNKAQSFIPEAHLRASAVSKVYRGWSNLFNKHKSILESDIQKLYSNRVKVVIDNDINKNG